MGRLTEAARAGRNRQRGGGLGGGGFGVSGIGALEGGKELLRLLAQLPERSAKTAMRKAHAAAGAEVRKAVKRRVPRRTGTLKKSIGVRVYRKVPSFDYTIIIGPRRGKKFKTMFEGRLTSPTKYAHLVELGTPRMPARSFLRAGLQESKAKALQVLGSKLGKGIELEALKLAKKQASVRGAFGRSAFG